MVGLALLSNLFATPTRPVCPFDKAPLETRAVGGCQNQTAFLGNSMAHQLEEEQWHQDILEEDPATAGKYNTTIRSAYMHGNVCQPSHKSGRKTLSTGSS